MAWVGGTQKNFIIVQKRSNERHSYAIYYVHCMLYAQFSDEYNSHFEDQLLSDNRFKPLRFSICTKKLTVFQLHG